MPERLTKYVVLVDAGSLLLLPDTLLCQLAKICTVGMEAVQHLCECCVDVLDIVLWNLFHFGNFVVLKVQKQADKLQISYGQAADCFKTTLRF